MDSGRLPMGTITRLGRLRPASLHNHVLLLSSLAGLLLAGCALPERQQPLARSSEQPLAEEQPAERHPQEEPTAEGKAKPDQPEVGPAQEQALAPTVEAPSSVSGKYARDSERIAADPIAFLREVAAKTAQLDEYRMTFYRQERLGIPPRLGPLEKMQATFRQEPFSVRLVWNDEEMPYHESVYVEGRNKGQVLVRERKGALPLLPPTVRRVDVDLPVKIGKSKNPITDFGPRRLLERTLAPFDDPQLAAITTVRYEGIVELEPMNRPAHLIRIERSQTPGIAYTRQDLYFDAETLLPAGTDLYLPNNVLDARYRYADIDTNVDLTDEDFRLSKDHPET